MESDEQPNIDDGDNATKKATSTKKSFMMAGPESDKTTAQASKSK